MMNDSDYVVLFGERIPLEEFNERSDSYGFSSSAPPAINPLEFFDRHQQQASPPHLALSGHALGGHQRFGGNDAPKHYDPMFGALDSALPFDADFEMDHGGATSSSSAHDMMTDDVLPLGGGASRPPKLEHGEAQRAPIVIPAHVWSSGQDDTAMLSSSAPASLIRPPSTEPLHGTSHQHHLLTTAPKNMFTNNNHSHTNSTTYTALDGTSVFSRSFSSGSVLDNASLMSHKLGGSMLSTSSRSPGGSRKRKKSGSSYSPMDGLVSSSAPATSTMSTLTFTRAGRRSSTGNFTGRAGVYSVGDPVLCNWQKKGQFYAAVVTGVETQGSRRAYTIQYEADGTEDKVPASQLRPQEDDTLPPRPRRAKSTTSSYSSPKYTHTNGRHSDESEFDLIKKGVSAHFLHTKFSRENLRHYIRKNQIPHVYAKRKKADFIESILTYLDKQE